MTYSCIPLKLQGKRDAGTDRRVVPGGIRHRSGVGGGALRVGPHGHVADRGAGRGSCPRG